MPTLRIGLMADDPLITEQLRSYVEAEGDLCTTFSSWTDLLSLSQSASCDLLLIDTPRKSGERLKSLSKLSDRLSKTRIALLTEPGDLETREDAASCGIHHLFTKPMLASDVRRWLRDALSTPECADSQSRVSGSPIVEELPNGRFFLAACPVMHDLYRNIRLLAPVDVPVLILGESGVGKEIVSHLLHKHSSRSQREMTDVNCAALPSELLESELFGYEAGAFTGALKTKPGKFESAHKSTLLLDEIGEMSATMQAKLLHVLQDGHFSRLGARASSQVDVRVLAATNVNLEEAIAARRFREDLFYRLNAFFIKVPPLRERREEIPHLMAEMLRRGAISLNRSPFEPSKFLVEAAQEYAWPGKLRELRNCITRILVLRDEKMAMADLVSKTRETSSTIQRTTPAESDAAPAPLENMRSVIRSMKDQTEMRLISDALRVTGWNRRRAAENLQISYRALLYKIQQYRLTQNPGTSSAVVEIPKPVLGEMSFSNRNVRSAV